MTQQSHIRGLLDRYMPNRRSMSLLEMMDNDYMLNLPSRQSAPGLLSFQHPGMNAPQMPVGSVFPWTATATAPVDPAALAKQQEEERQRQMMAQQQFVMPGQGG